MKKALMKMLPVMLALCLWVAPMSFPAFAAEGDVCEISGTTYATLGDALAAVEDGQTIKLLKDIDYYGGIVIEDKSVTFNLNGFNLNVVNPETEGSDAQRTGLYVKGDAGNASVALEGAGEFNVTGNKYGVYVYFIGSADMDAKATVTNATATGNDGCAAYAYGENAELTVKGDATATGVGGIGAKANSKGLVTVMGNVTATADDTYTGDYDCAAVEAWDDGYVLVEGNVTATGDDSIGVLSAGSYVAVKGDVTGDLGGAYATAFANIRITGDVISTGSSGFGVQASDDCDIVIGGNVTADDIGAWIITGSEEDAPSNITIDGIINAPNYIRIGEKVFTFVEGNPYEGRLVYTDESLGSVAVAEFAGGDGSEGSPYLVAHAYHLYNVRNHLDKCFRQTEDINLNYFVSGSGWEPIGDNSKPFTGTYDGDDKTISNLFINRDGTDYVGLFGCVKESAKIQDLVLEDVDVTGKHYVGGLAGWNDGLIDNLSVTGDVTGYDDIGGLAGQNDDGSITGSCFEGAVTGNDDNVGGLVGDNNGGITDCHTDVTVTGEDDYIGGLAGWNVGPITGSYASGTVKGSEVSDYVGGLVGWNVTTDSENGEIEASYSTCEVEGYNIVGGLVGLNSGSVIDSYASGTVKGHNDVGGLAGWNVSTGSENGEIETSYSTGEVEGNNCVGGLVGWNQGPVSDSYASGTVNGNDFVGGLAGSNEASITNCYSIGVVTGNYDVGGLAGANVDSVTNSYWDTDTSGRANSAGGEGKATAEMKQQGTYVDWNFETIWAINDSDNNGYPFLKWQGTAPPPTYALTITAGTGGSITTGDSGDYAEGTVINIAAAPSSKYSFNEWSSSGGGTFGSTTSASTTFTMPAGDVIVTASFTYTGGGGGGGGGRSPRPKPSYEADVSGTDISKTTLPVDVNTDTESAATDLDNLAEDTFTGGGTTVVTVPSIPGVNSYTLEIPASSLAGGQQRGSLTFSTPEGSITTPGNMLSGVPGTKGKKAGITIGKGDKSDLPKEVKAAIGDRPLVQLTLTLNGRQTDWNNPEAPVTVSVPYTPKAAELANPEHIIVWYIDGAGNAVSIPNGRYDQETGTVTFTTTHFSYYAVAYVQKNFDDLENVDWAKKPIEVLASKGILESTSETGYSPRENITRADFLCFLVRTLGVDAKVDGNFYDIRSDAYYYKETGIAKALGIASGTGDNKFSPDAYITRQDMMALTERALRMLEKLEVQGMASDLDRFSDKPLVAAYAVDSVASLVNEGLIVGSDDKLNPLGNTTRAEAAVFLYRIYNKYTGF
jgi:hypothetical protein